jgi:hypothetical protein
LISIAWRTSFYGGVLTAIAILVKRCSPVPCSEKTPRHSRCDTRYSWSCLGLTRFLPGCARLQLALDLSNEGLCSHGLAQHLGCGSAVQQRPALAATKWKRSSRYGNPPWRARLPGIGSAMPEASHTRAQQLGTHATPQPQQTESAPFVGLGTLGLTNG